jgi:Asp/Glu/hydantoin racemase
MVRAQRISAIPTPVERVFPSVALPHSGPGGTERIRGEGPFLGILMLESRFPRPLGDIGHPESFAVPTRRLVVSGATAPKVVQDASALAAGGLLRRFTGAARRLESEGAAAITTSCGFLVLFQRELQEAVRVPVVTSSLLMLPGLLEEHPKVGVLTISSEHLGPQFLKAAGVPAVRLADVIVQGVEPGGEFATAILGDHPRMDFARAEAEVVQAARELRRRAPALATLVLECTNLPPYASRIEQATGLKTYSLLQCETLLKTSPAIP